MKHWKNLISALLQKIFDFQKLQQMLIIIYVKVADFTERTVRGIKKTKPYILPPSWYPFHVANDLRFWYFQGSCQELYKRRSIDFVDIVSGRNLRWIDAQESRLSTKMESIMCQVWVFYSSHNSSVGSSSGLKDLIKKYHKQWKEDASDLPVGFCISLLACWKDPSLKC